MLVTMANGAIAQAITTGMRRALRPALKIAETELPNWLAIASGDRGRSGTPRPRPHRNDCGKRHSNPAGALLSSSAWR
jgi:hypothetical protein